MTRSWEQTRVLIDSVQIKTAFKSTRFLAWTEIHYLERSQQFLQIWGFPKKQVNEFTGKNVWESLIKTLKFDYEQLIFYDRRWRIWWKISIPSSDNQRQAGSINIGEKI